MTATRNLVLGAVGLMVCGLSLTTTAIQVQPIPANGSSWGVAVTPGDNGCAFVPITAPSDTTPWWQVREWPGAVDAWVSEPRLCCTQDCNGVLHQCQGSEP